MLKKFIFSVFFIFISLNLFAKDKWYGEDKELHFKFSYGLHLISYSCLHYVTSNSNLTNQFLSSTFALSLGLGKELYDIISKNGTGFSYKDLIFDVAGITSGVFICSFLYQKTNNPIYFITINRNRYYIYCILRY